jgi:hypothetical protein
LRVAASNVRVRENSGFSNLRFCSRQGFMNITNDKMVGVGNTCRVRIHDSIENENLAIRAQGAQVIVRPPVAEAQLEDGSFEFGNSANSLLQTGALSLQAPNEAIQPTHIDTSDTNEKPVGDQTANNTL